MRVRIARAVARSLVLICLALALAPAGSPATPVVGNGERSRLKSGGHTAPSSPSTPNKQLLPPH